jgi:hypothetical protein
MLTMCTCMCMCVCVCSHDVAAYLSTKEPDLGSSCPEYTAFGHCSSGFSCRFGDCHIDRALLVNKRRPEEEGALLPHSHTLTALLSVCLHHLWMCNSICI